MILYSTTILLASPFFTLFLFGYVYGQRRKNRLNNAFLGLAAAFFFLTFCDFCMRVLPPGKTSHLLLEAATSIFFVTNLMVLYFFYALVKKKTDTIFFICLFATCIAIVLPLIDLPMHKSTINIVGGINTPLPNAIFWIIFAVYVSPIFLYGLGLAVISYLKEKDKSYKKRVFIWLCGILTSFFYLVCIHLIAPTFFHTQRLSTYGSIAAIIIELFAYWSVRRHNFLTVNIHQLEEILDKVFKESGDAIFLLDQTGVVVRANDAAIELFGLKPETIQTLSIPDIIPEIASEKSFYNFEIEFNVAGIKRSTIITKTNLSAADETLHYILTIRDITQMKQVEAEQLRTQKLEALGVLAGGIAHDFNNFLCGIVSSFSYAKINTEQNKAVYDVLAEGERAALEARGLTHQLLTFAKGGRPVCEDFNVLDILVDACTFSTRGSKVKLLFDQPKQSVRIHADESQIRQVFQNIVINACQAMPSGGILKVCSAIQDISEKHISSLGAGRYFVVSFSDQGCGIPSHILPRIFEPYFTTKKSGNGLGLAIAFMVLKRHNGHIVASSEIGKGSTFVVYLPLAVSGDSQTNFLPVAPYNENSQRVLIMDDVKVIRLTLSMLLKQLGYHVDEAETGEEALSKFEDGFNSNSSYKFIITDLTVPAGMGGKELAQKIAHYSPSIPIILSSGYSENVEIANYHEYGFAAVLRKPYSLQELIKVLEIVDPNHPAPFGT